jgi:hypothetical protein
MSPTRPPPRMRLRHAALAAAAALAVLWPLGQVMHFHDEELLSLQAERAALDPLSLTVEVQRHLIGHDLVSSRVLSGRHALEPERRLRQADVDGAIWRLKGTLSAGLWTRALRESDSLEKDWRLLARRVSLRQLDGATSRASHRLLVEQVLQVTDLVSAAAAPGLPPGLVPVLASAVPAAPVDEAAARAILAALAGFQDHLQAQSQRLDTRTQRLQMAQRQLATGLVVVCAAALAVLAVALRRARPLPGGPAPDPGEGVRRGHGRRTTDVSPRVDHAQDLLKVLRQQDAPSTAHPPDPPP